MLINYSLVAKLVARFESDNLRKCFLSTCQEHGVVLMIKRTVKSGKPRTGTAGNPIRHECSREECCMLDRVPRSKFCLQYPSLTRSLTLRSSASNQLSIVAVGSCCVKDTCAGCRGLTVDRL